MNRFKFPVTVTILMCLVLIPTSCVFALKGTDNTNSKQIIQTSSFVPLTTVTGNQPGANPQPTPNSSSSTSQSASTATNRVFFPTVVKSEIAIGLHTYYVSLSGSDSNPGSLAQPWRTIQKAANSLVPGDTVKILPGTYTEKFTPQNSGTAAAYITYTADPGTVVIDGTGVSLSSDAKGDGLVQIQGKSYIRVQNLTLRNSSANCVNISDNSSGTGSNYIEISALTVQNCNKVGIRARFTDHLLVKNNAINHINYSSGIGVWYSTNATVDHNTITNAHYYHECQGAYDEALTIATVNHFEVMNNTLDNTEANPAGFCLNPEKLGIDVKESSQNGLVHNNTVSHMTASSIYLDGWHAGANGTPTLNHVNIYQNRVSDGGGITVGCEQPDGVVEYINIYDNIVLNASFSGIQVRGAYGDGVRKNITIYNNTIYGALPAGGNGGAGIYVTTTNLGSNNGDAPVIIRNNISMFYFLSSGGGTVGQIRAANAAIASMITADHNLIYGPQSCSTDYPACVEVGNRVSASSTNVFASPSAFDLHLKSGSPAIGIGLPISAVPVDFDGQLRPLGTGAGYDVGAYQHK